MAEFSEHTVRRGDEAQGEEQGGVGSAAVIGAVPHPRPDSAGPAGPAPPGAPVNKHGR